MLFELLFLVCVSSLLVLSCLTLCGQKKKEISSENNKVPAPKVASPKKEQKSEKKMKPKKEPEKKENSKNEIIQKTQASSRSIKTLTGDPAMGRKIHDIQVMRSSISITGGDCASESHSLNKNSKIAQLEIAAFFKKLSKVARISWSGCDIDDDIAKELTRIHLDDMFVNRCNITAGHVQIELLVAKHPNKLRLFLVRASPTIVSDQTLSRLNGSIEISSLSATGGSDFATPTTITDSFLKSLQLEFEARLANYHSCVYTRTKAVSLVNYFNPKLSFGVIKEFVKIIPHHRLGLRESHYLGIIGYQEMATILQYYHEKTWIEWNSTIFNVDGTTYLQFDNIFAEGGQYCRDEDDPSFCISLYRDSNGKVDDISIPEEFIVANTYSNFKALVQVVQSEISLESIAPASIGLESLEVFLFDKFGFPTLEVRAFIIQQPNIRNQKSHSMIIRRTNVDLSSAEKIFVKIFKLCSSIEFSPIRGTNLTMNDKLFTLLSEHAKNTRIKKNSSMDMQLTVDNHSRLRENKGIFKMFRVNENNCADCARLGKEV